VYLRSPCPPSVLNRKASRLDALREPTSARRHSDAGINPYKGVNNFNNCGGLGQCGTCVVEVLDGARNLSPRSDVEQVYLADRPASYRLSCRTTVNGDVSVRTRPDAAVGKGSNSLVGALKALIGKA